MGIAPSMAKLIMGENLSGSILQLGRQNIIFNFDELQSLARSISFNLSQPKAINPSNLGYLKDHGYIDDNTFFESLGFEEIHSLDASDYEGATYTWDLNRLIPKDFHGKYDVIFNGGTLEHIFDLPMVLSNIHYMLKPGGVVIHSSPCSNFVDHGFYSFSPQLFHDYYEANGYQILRSLIFILNEPPLYEPWNIYEYTPGSLDSMTFGGFKKGEMVNHYMSAKKIASATHTQIPQQGQSRR